MKRNDKQAKIIIFTLSAIVFISVGLMRKLKNPSLFDFDTHIFPAISATINSIVALLLLGGLWAIKSKKQELHKKFMLYALIFSFVFFISYFLYHISTDEAIYGGEGLSKFIYYFILITHVVLAGVILPFILYAAYYGLTKSYQQHKKLTRYVWPIWFYVSVSGVIVYFMILPYY